MAGLNNNNIKERKQAADFARYPWIVGEVVESLLRMALADIGKKRNPSFPGEIWYVSSILSNLSQFIKDRLVDIEISKAGEKKYADEYADELKENGSKKKEPKIKRCRDDIRVPSREAKIREAEKRWKYVEQMSVLTYTDEMRLVLTQELLSGDYAPGHLKLMHKYMSSSTFGNLAGKLSELKMDFAEQAEGADSKEDTPAVNAAKQAKKKMERSIEIMQLWMALQQALEEAVTRVAKEEKAANLEGKAADLEREGKATDILLDPSAGLGIKTFTSKSRRNSLSAPSRGRQRSLIIPSDRLHGGGKTPFAPALPKTEEKSQAPSTAPAPIIPFIPPEEKRPPIKKSLLDLVDIDLWVTRIALLIEACLYLGLMGALGLLNFLSLPVVVWFIVLGLGGCLFLALFGLNYYYQAKGLSSVEALQQNSAQVAIKAGQEKHLPVEAYEESEKVSLISAYFFEKLRPFALEGELPRGRRASQPALQQITTLTPESSAQPEPPRPIPLVKSSSHCDGLSIRAMRVATPKGSKNPGFWSSSPVSPSSARAKAGSCGQESQASSEVKLTLSPSGLENVGEEDSDLESDVESADDLASPRRQLDFTGEEEVHVQFVPL